MRSLSDRLDRTLAEARALRAELTEAANRRERSAIERLMHRYTPRRLSHAK